MPNQLLNKIKNILNQPYPFDNSLKFRLIIVFGVGIFIASFLNIFQPFGISELVNKYKILYISGFGFVSSLAMFIILIILPYIFPKYFCEEKWKVFSEIISMSLILILISVLNILYVLIFDSCYFPDTEFNQNLIIQSFSNVFLVGFFPITFIVIIKQNRLAKKNIQNANHFNIINNESKSTKQDNNNLISIKLKSGKEISVCEKSELICIQAEDNYATFFFRRDGKLNKELLRITLKEIETQLSGYDSILRCHKSYIANITKSIRISGNAQGYKIHFSELDFTVPISRTFAKSILQSIEN